MSRARVRTGKEESKNENSNLDEQLIKADREGNVEVPKPLIDQGADIEAKNKKVSSADHNNIGSIKLHSNYKSLSKDFEWNEIPQFAVILGENGSGKTHLLQYVENHSDLKDNVAYYPAHHIQEEANLIIGSSLDAVPSLSKKEKHLLDIKQKLPTTDKEEIKELFKEIMRKVGEMVFPDLGFLSLAENYYIVVFSKLMSVLEAKDPNGEERELAREAKNIIGPNTSDKFNTYLKRYDIPYKLYMPLMGDKNLSPLFVNEGNVEKDRKNPDAYHPKDLSSGENLLLKVLEWSYRLETYGTLNNKSVILLDEPDANLNPKLAKLLINLIRDNIVSKGVQIIMTTHNPVTVNMLDKEDLFMMKRSDRGRSFIEPVKSKKEAVNFLTGDLVTINDVFGVVLTESRDDSLYYNLVFEELCKKDAIEKTPPLLFKECSRKTKLNAEGNDDGGIKKVMHFVKMFRDEGLEDFIYGIIDRDYGNKLINGVFSPKGRHSVENYLTDPILVFEILRKRSDSNNSYQQILSKLEDELRNKIEGKKFKDFSLGDDELQLLVKAIFKVAVDRVNSLVNDAKTKSINEENNNKALDPDKLMRGKTTNLEEMQIVISTSNNQDSYREVEFSNGCKVSYPKIMFEMRGHDLKDMLSRAFRPTKDRVAGNQYSGKDTNYFSRDALLKQFKEHPMIPMDLKDVFKQLQTYIRREEKKKENKSNLSAQNLEQKEGKRNNSELNEDQLRAEIEKIASKITKIVKGRQKEEERNQFKADVLDPKKRIDVRNILNAEIKQKEQALEGDTLNKTQKRSAKKKKNTFQECLEGLSKIEPLELKILEISSNTRNKGVKPQENKNGTEESANGKIDRIREVHNMQDQLAILHQEMGKHIEGGNFVEAQNCNKQISELLEKQLQKDVKEEKATVSELQSPRGANIEVKQGQSVENSCSVVQPNISMQRSDVIKRIIAERKEQLSNVEERFIAGRKKKLSNKYFRRATAADFGI
jgi:ABC-type cobalamin/Fe3+-siderophores transport system ATPase subunit